jgi:outer membrane protein insertion porin family
MMRGVLTLVVLALLAAPAAAQSNPESICGLQVPKPSRSPEPQSAPVVVAMMLCFDKQGGTSLVEPETYLYYIQLKPSEPSRDRWVPYDAAAEQVLLADFRRLWNTGFLDDLAIEIVDYRFDNGAVGKVVVFRVEERQRIKLVDYEGATRVTRSDITDRLKERGLDLRLDAFLDAGLLKRVSTVVRELYAEKGYQYAQVTASVREMPGGPKRAHVVFQVSEGPKVAIRDVEFLGNQAFTDAALARVLKTNKARGLLSLVSGGGTYNELKFADDAQSVVDHYRDHGYITAQVGPPTLRVLDDSADGRTRWVQLRVEITEGDRYQVGNFAVEGNTVVRSETLRPLFRLAEGEPYRQERIVKGLEQARELYGAGGYFEFTAYPELNPRDPADTPTVDVTLRVTEGKQYFVNRIEFTGNSHTRDEVIRREMGLLEGGVFNTEALKFSVRRLNQLGYFKPLDDKALAVDRTPGTDNQVTVKVTVEEQNRNQLNFGAGASQYEGLFVSFSYTTSNFLGRGESLTASLQAGQRSRNYQLTFSEPFVLGRNITAGASVFSRKIDYALSGSAIDYSEVRSGINLTSGVPLRRFTRLFATYGYEIVDTAMTDDLRQSLLDGSSASAFLVQDGRFVESSITPSIVHDTVDNPFAPRSGRRLTASYQYAGGILGGTSRFIKPEVSAIQYLPVTRRTAFGVRVNAGRIWNFGSTELPYYQRYFLGGETQIRGVDVRTVGPLNDNQAAIGGTSFALFNAEYYFDILPQARALLFHDAGQAFGDSQAFNLRNLRTSSGVELRVTLPVINVPFRLIYAWNIYRDSFQPARGFRFAVGTTF